MSRPRITGVGQLTLYKHYIGCDISKKHLDFFIPQTGKSLKIANEPLAIADFVKDKLSADSLVVMEATGSYDRALRLHLDEQGLSYNRLNPTRAHAFSCAANYKAKTDPMDARMLSEMGQRFEFQASPAIDKHRESLAFLQQRYDQLVKMRSEEKTRSHETLGSPHQSQLNHIKWLNQEIKAFEKQIADLIKQQSNLESQEELMRSMPGVGPVTAWVLLALVPELGTLSDKEIANLAGLAPLNRDSGLFQGTRSIRGGRRRVRKALYMAALIASRKNKRMNTFYENLLERGKGKKVAIIAVARKMIIILNAMIRESATYNDEHKN